jgi:pimeloyl-ACP methyl ester carboxylesterase
MHQSHVSGSYRSAIKKSCGRIVAALTLCCAGALAVLPVQAQEVQTIERFVPHVSTVPANAGQTVGLYLREKVLAGGKAQRPVVLFVHGGFSPSNVAYDLDYKDFSWMADLAKAGFDVFAMTNTAYGSSPRPMMDDPCNVVAEQQKLLIPKVLKEPCAPHYPFKMVSSQTEWDEVAAVVDYIVKLRNVKKISMVGWSTGTPRIGGYAATHPDKVDRIVFLAPAPFFDDDQPPAVMPEPGAPVILQTRQRLEGERWMADVHCDDQIDDAKVKDVMWDALMKEEGIGATWMDGGVMRAPNRMNYGWRTTVPKIKAPVLILLGEFDNFQKRLDTWKALTVEKKAFIKISCGSHYLIYEKNRTVLHAAAREWLSKGTVVGKQAGMFAADANGVVRPQ